MERNLSFYNCITEHEYNILAGTNWPNYKDFVSGNNVPGFVYNELDLLIKDVKKFDNKAFCVLPFYGIEYPDNSVCCLLKTKSNLDIVKKNMLNGIRPEECQCCWALEDKGITSDRILKNELLNFVYKDLHLIEEECLRQENKTIHYKIDSSNSCNATCITCDGKSSTSWIQLEKKYKTRTHKHWKLSQDKHKIDYKNAKSINFRGGEPLLEKKNFTILENLIQNDNTECMISFTTNGSIKLSEKQIYLLSHFNKVNFCLSIDGIDSVFEYIRYPLVWSNVLQNIEQYRACNLQLSVSYTISNLNILFYTQTTDWFKTNNLPFINNIVYTPEYFSPTSLPLAIKKRVIDENNEKFLNTHTYQDELNFNKFITKIKEQDEWKKIKMQDYIPQFYNLIKEYL